MESLGINNTEMHLMNSLFDYSSFVINSLRYKNNEQRTVPVASNISKSFLASSAAGKR